MNLRFFPSLPRFALSLLLAVTAAMAEDGILIRDGQSVAFMGDSITAGGWGMASGYVRLVVDALAKNGVKVTPIPAGVSGNTSKDMLDRLERDVLSKQPNWLLLSCGVNDVWHGPTGVELEPYKQNITAIVDQAEAKGIKVILLTATPIGEEDNANNQKLIAYNTFLRQLASQRKLPLADLNQGFQAVLSPLHATRASRFLTVDGVHMNTEGNVVMATGCLRAMGISAARMAAIEQAWLRQPATATIAVTGDLKPDLPVTLGEFRRLEAMAQQRGTDVIHLSGTLWLRALAAVIATHAAEPLLDIEALKKEARIRLLADIDALAKLPTDAKP